MEVQTADLLQASQSRAGCRGINHGVTVYHRAAWETLTMDRVRQLSAVAIENVFDRFCQLIEGGEAIAHTQ